MLAKEQTVITKLIRRNVAFNITLIIGGQDTKIPFFHVFIFNGLDVAQIKIQKSNEKNRKRVGLIELNFSLKL